MNPFYQPVQSTYVSQFVPMGDGLPSEALAKYSEGYGKQVDALDNETVKLNSIINSQQAIPTQSEKDRLTKFQATYTDRLKSIADEATLRGRVTGLKQVASDLKSDATFMGFANRKKQYDDYSNSLKDNPDKNKFIDASLKLDARNTDPTTFSGLTPVKQEERLASTIDQLTKRGRFNQKKDVDISLNDKGEQVTKDIYSFSDITTSKDYVGIVESAKETLLNNHSNWYRQQAILENASDPTIDVNARMNELAADDAYTIVNDKLNQVYSAEKIRDIKTNRSKEAETFAKEAKIKAEQLKNLPGSSIVMSENSEFKDADYNKILTTAQDVITKLNNPAFVEIKEGKHDLFELKNGRISYKDGVIANDNTNKALAGFNETLTKVTETYNTMKNLYKISSDAFDKEYGTKDMDITISTDPENNNKPFIKIDNLTSEDIESYLLKLSGGKDIVEGSALGAYNLFLPSEKEEGLNADDYIKEKGLEQLNIDSNIYAEVIKTNAGGNQRIIYYVKKGDKLYEGLYTNKKQDDDVFTPLVESIRENYKKKIDAVIEEKFSNNKVSVPYKDATFAKDEETIQKISKQLTSAFGTNDMVVELLNGDGTTESANTTVLAQSLGTDKVFAIKGIVPLDPKNGKGLLVNINYKDGNTATDGNTYYIKGPAIDAFIEENLPESEDMGTLMGVFNSQRGYDFSGYTESATVTGSQWNALGYFSDKNNPLKTIDKKNTSYPIKEIRFEYLDGGMVNVHWGFEQPDDLNQDKFDVNINENTPPITFDGHKKSFANENEALKHLATINNQAGELGKMYLKSYDSSAHEELTKDPTLQEIGFDYDEYTKKTASQESANGRYTVNPDSTARGTYQLVNDTVVKLRDKYDELKTLPYDKEHEKQFFDFYVKNTMGTMKNHEVPITYLNTYWYHHFAPGVAKVLSNGQQLDNLIAGNRSMTVADIFRELTPTSAPGIINYNPSFSKTLASQWLDDLRSKFSQQ